MKKVQRNSSSTNSRFSSTRCPHCGKTAKSRAQISLLFGWRTMESGEIRPQSWCYDCRAKSW